MQRRLGGHHGRIGRVQKKENFLPPPRFESRTVQPVASRLYCVEKTTERSTLTTLKLCVISGFRREVAEKCVLLGYYYAASSGNCLAEIANIKWCQRLINEVRTRSIDAMIMTAETRSTWRKTLSVHQNNFSPSFPLLVSFHQCSIIAFPFFYHLSYILLANNNHIKYTTFVSCFNYTPDKAHAST